MTFTESIAPPIPDAALMGGAAFLTRPLQAGEARRPKVRHSDSLIRSSFGIATLPDPADVGPARLLSRGGLESRWEVAA